MIRRLSALMAALLLAGCSAPANGSGELPAVPEHPPAASEHAPMQCLYYERELFLSAMSAPRPYESAGRLAAGMVPHHLTASDMIAGFFSLAAQNPEGYDAVLIVSPSHYPENCASDVVTSTAGWDTPYGSAEAASGIAERLLQNASVGAADQPDAVEADHGAAGLVPFIKYYLPDAKIAVCLLSNKLERGRLAAVAAEIADICAGGRVLLVASVDCSHYLAPEEAELRDAQTAEAIESMNFERILRFGDENVDSPQALTVFLETARSKSAELERLDHSSSAEKLPHALSNPIYRDGVTTYLVYAAWE